MDLQLILQLFRHLFYRVTAAQEGSVLLQYGAAAQVGLIGLGGVYSVGGGYGVGDPKRTP